jgi:hypothetical protein
MMNEEKELTVEELEKTVRETLVMLSKKLIALAARDALHGVLVQFSEDRNLQPQYEGMDPPYAKMFLGLQQQGPQTLCINVVDHSRDGLFIPAGEKK